MAVLKEGSKGKDIEKLQAALNKLGAKPKLQVDGIFGPKTKAAVIAFQKKAELKGDGVVGAYTAAAMEFGGALPKMAVEDCAGKAKETADWQSFAAKYTHLISVIDGYTDKLDKALSAHLPKARDMVVTNNPIYEQLVKTYAAIEKKQQEFKGLILKDPKRAKKITDECDKLFNEVKTLTAKIEANSKNVNKAIDAVEQHIGITAKGLAKGAQELRKHWDKMP